MCVWDLVEYLHVFYEQFYQKSKSDFVKDKETCSKIMITSDPEKVFFLEQKVIDFDERRWKQECDDIMLVGLNE